MRIRLKFGEQDAWQLTWPEGSEVVDWSSPAGDSVADPALAAQAALAAPIGHPPLEVSVVAGDRITLALEPGLPQSSPIARGIVQYLLEAGHSPSDITVLWRPAWKNDPGPVEEFDESLRGALHFVRHDAEDAASLAYLAATRGADPVYLNRALCDADFVLPVGVARPAAAFDNPGLMGGLFPAFSQRETQQRLRPAVGRGEASRRRRVAAETDEASWLLGVQFVVQVVPGACGSVLEVLAGSVTTLHEEAPRRCAAAWHHVLTQGADLVVASIGGGPAQQSWDNVARALVMATRAVNDHGSIVLVTGLDTRPGSALRRFGWWTATDPPPKSRKRDVEPDLVVAQALLAARERAHIYLFSHLSNSVVESIGAIPISEAGEVEQLARRHPTGLVLGDAQFATLSLAALEPTS